MEGGDIQSIEIHVGAVSKEEKQRWAKEHARRLQCLFEQWQKPLGISSDEYSEYLEKDLLNCCNDPLIKSLIDSIA